MNNCKGLSLFELCVSIALTAVILLSSWPVLKSLAAGKNLKQSADKVLDTLEHHARMSSLTGENSTISFSLSDNAVYLLADKEGDIKSKQLLRLAPGIRIVKADFAGFNPGRNSLLLHPDGSASPGSVILENKLFERCSIVQSLRGARRIVCS